MSYTLGNGWNEDCGYYSYPSRRGVGQRLHSGCRKSDAYKLPMGWMPGAWKKWPHLGSVRRNTYRPAIAEARRRRFFQAMNRNPLYYIDIDYRPAGALRLGYAWEWRTRESDRPATELPTGRRTITLQLDGTTAQLLDELAALCTEADQESGSFTSHGPLTVESMLQMVIQDLAMVVSRPGSWEGANMARVFASHGYQV
ncbi:hypothetical protein [Magnetospirillum sp. UT-4]|uniref:hypothetical protein n=1 Tax=Magnetospirillum sp. UT-4 TaxID=2681467 RepID=UPI001380241B|nr:hypothetical protein [Magnetospirillum sp. UT-4]CAA7619254.1 hypothetical protein MTBUT4_300014 [Magnetospirillum sp. UT-4]